MISRAVCAPRVCLSCRIGLARRRAGLGAGLLVRYDDSGLRRYASDRSVVQKKDIVEALISGKTSLEDREKAAKREKPRQKKRQQRQKDADDLDWPEADDASFDWKVGLVEEPQKDPTASPPNIRTAAAPDEPFPVERLSWRSAQPKPKALIETSEALLRPEEPKELSDAHESIPGPQEPEETPYINRPVPQPRESETFKDAFLRQEHLSIEALGRRVGALIIKNPNQLHRKGKGSTFLPEPTTPLGDLDWKSMVPTEGAEIDAATEASGHIEELRPTDSLTIPRNHYHKLKEELAFGFTGNQLALYYSQKDKSAAPQPSETPAYPWVVDQTAWKPSTPEFTGKEAKKKHHLARMIMTLQWGLQVQEEVESPGLATVTVRGDIFQLVAQLHTGVLDTLTAELLDESIGEMITANPRQHTLEIYARKAAVPLLLARLDELVQTVVTRSVSVEDFDPKLLRKDALDELARVTKTVIKHSRETKQLEVSRIAEDDFPESTDQETTPTEDAADTVLRLLRGRPTQRLQGEEQIIARRFRTQAVVSKFGMLVPHNRENRSMSWRDRLRHWSRFVSAIGVRGEFKGKWLKFTEKVQLPAPELSVFEDGAKNRLTATFGHVLHSKPEGREAKKSKLRRRIIAPVFPHPASFTEFLPVKNSDMRKWSSIVLNFAPAPGNHEGEAPEVRLTLPITSENDFSNFSMPKDSTLNAIVPWFVKDTLVPEESVDARIVQQREMPLDISKQKPIQEFFAASEFNLTEGRLRTPSSTQFSMPKRWLDKEAKGSSTVGVPYMFAGLEIQQTVSLAWKGHFLIYNSIEAGQHGGTRQELSLEAKISTINAEKAAAQREQFLKLLEIAIEGKYWSWNKGSEQVRELPDEEDSFWQRNSSDPNQQQIPMPSQDDLDMPLQNLSEPLEKGSSLIRELSPGPSDAIDMGVEVEEALLTGERLVEDIEEIIGSHSELNAQGYHEDTGTGKEFEETLQTGERLAESIESIEEALGEQSGLSAQGHDTQYTSVGEEFEEALAAGQLLVEETEVALQTREETSTEQHPTSRKCVGQ